MSRTPRSLSLVISDAMEPPTSPEFDDARPRRPVRAGLSIELGPVRAGHLDDETLRLSDDAQAHDRTGGSLPQVPVHLFPRRDFAEVHRYNDIPLPDPGAGGRP